MTEITLLDGGMGKELRRIGAPFRQPEWSALALLEAPESVVEAHANFIEAGAQVIITNNYAVVPYHLGEAMIAERGSQLTALAGQLARQAADAADAGVRVAGSLPPLFGSYEPDKFDPGRAPAYYRMIVEALDPYVELWLTETLSTTAEIDVIAAAVRTSGSGQPLWVSLTVPDHWTDETVTLHSGASVADIVATVSAHSDLVEAVLFNCSRAEQIGPAIAEMTTALRTAGLAARTGGYANGFPDVRSSGEYAANATVLDRRDDLSAAGYAEVVSGWVEDGATIIGGCCDMYPEDIAALAHRFLSEGPGSSVSA